VYRKNKKYPVTKQIDFKFLQRITSNFAKGRASSGTVRTAFGKALPVFPLTKILHDITVSVLMVHIGTVPRTAFSINSAHFLGVAVPVFVHKACAQIGLALSLI